jgi:hypothetical protein
MKHFKIQYILLLVIAVLNTSIIPQNKAVTPTSSNFSYPQSLFIDTPNGNIWVTDFSNNRVLRFDVSSLTGVAETHSANSPESYFLSQNYPNPFNPSTQISFSLKNNDHASLTVYNILGQAIETMFNEVATRNTVYTIVFDARNLPSGIYLYTLRTSYGTEVKKMCLLK